MVEAKLKNLQGSALKDAMNRASRGQQEVENLQSLLQSAEKQLNSKEKEIKELIKKLKKKLNGEIPDLVEAEAMLFMLEKN